jgi:hypothetical protein
MEAAASDAPGAAPLPIQTFGSMESDHDDDIQARLGGDASGCAVRDPRGMRQ